jgi:hypothetical protein
VQRPAPAAHSRRAAVRAQPAALQADSQHAGAAAAALPVSLGQEQVRLQVQVQVQVWQVAPAAVHGALPQAVQACLLAQGALAMRLEPALAGVSQTRASPLQARAAPRVSAWVPTLLALLVPLRPDATRARPPELRQQPVAVALPVRRALPVRVPRRVQAQSGLQALPGDPDLGGRVLHAHGHVRHAAWPQQKPRAPRVHLPMRHESAWTREWPPAQRARHGRLRPQTAQPVQTPP